ncbi:MAG: sodium/solute symporter, partial [Planctomycetes bacterium]|nr:sodium/solute symporter [Planctomycetota bacterium]
TIYGGLKSVVWSDLIQGGALILCGAIVAFLGLRLIGDGSLIDGWRSFVSENADKLHMYKPWDDKDVPWVAVFIGGLWIPNLFYWGLNQFITQRTLGAKSLAEGQKGIMFAALIKLVIPFIIVMPGIMAFQLYGDEITVDDKAYPYMISQILPPWLRGVMFAALLGAVMSTFNSGINSASTIFTIDIFGKYVEKNASAKKQVLIGRIATAVIMVVACLWAPIVGSAGGVFKYIQEIWGFISPGIVAAFLVGLVVRKAPALAGKMALILSPVLYAICRVPGWLSDYSFMKKNPGFIGDEIPHPEGVLGIWVQFSKMAFLHHMMIIFLILAGVMVLITKLKSLSEPVTMPVKEGFDTKTHKMVYVWGSAIIALTTLLYIIFW